MLNIYPEFASYKTLVTLPLLDYITVLIPELMRISFQYCLADHSRSCLPYLIIITNVNEQKSPITVDILRIDRTGPQRLHSIPTFGSTCPTTRV